MSDVRVARARWKVIRHTGVFGRRGLDALLHGYWEVFYHWYFVIGFLNIVLVAFLLVNVSRHFQMNQLDMGGHGRILRELLTAFFALVRSLSCVHSDVLYEYGFSLKLILKNNHFISIATFRNCL